MAAAIQGGGAVDAAARQIKLAMGKKQRRRLVGNDVGCGRH